MVTKLMYRTVLLAAAALLGILIVAYIVMWVFDK